MVGGHLKWDEIFLKALAGVLHDWAERELAGAMVFTSLRSRLMSGRLASVARITHADDDCDQD